MKISSVFVLAAGIMFLAAWLATVGEDTPNSLITAYFFLGLANIAFSQV